MRAVMNLVMQKTQSIFGKRIKKRQVLWLNTRLFYKMMSDVTEDSLPAAYQSEPLLNWGRS